MRAKIRRHVADTQTPIGIPIRRAESTGRPGIQRVREARGPRQVIRQKISRLRRGIGQTGQQIVRKGPRRVRSNLQGTPIVLEAGLDFALFAKDPGQVRARFHLIGRQLEGPAKHRRRPLQVPRTVVDRS